MSDSEGIEGDTPATASPPQFRKSRSRKQRPCDRCRVKKVRCYLEATGTPCALCRSENIPCTFRQGPQPRRRHPEQAEDRAEPSQEAGKLVEDGTLMYYQGATEHTGEPSFFSELQEPQEAFPNFRNVPGAASSLSSHPYAAHRVDQTSNKVLSLTSTTKDDLFDLIKPYGPRLVEAYFQHVWPILPATSKSIVLAFLREDQPWARHKEAHVAFTPCLAAIVVIGSNYWDVDPAFKGKKRPDMTPVHDFVRRSIYLDLRMPHMVTLHAFVLKYFHLAYGPGDNNFETWSAIGAMVTAAQNIGLHEEPSNWVLAPWEKHVRRRLWWIIFIAEKCLAHSLGRASIIFHASYNVLPLTEADMEEEDVGGHFMQLYRLATIIDDLLSSVYSPRHHTALMLDHTQMQAIGESFFDKLDQWRNNLGPKLAMDAPSRSGGGNSNAFLHLSYFAVQISVHKAMIRSDGAETLENRKSAIDTMFAAAEWARTLTTDHLQAFWPTHSRHDFCHISAFMLALLLTSRSEEEFDALLVIVNGWRAVLDKHVGGAEKLLGPALAKLESYGAKDNNRLLELWRNKHQLAYYQTLSAFAPALSPSVLTPNGGAHIYPFWGSGIGGISFAGDTPSMPYDSQPPGAPPPPVWPNQWDQPVLGSTPADQAFSDYHHQPLAESARLFFWSDNPSQLQPKFWETDPDLLTNTQVGLLPEYSIAPQSPVQAFQPAPQPATRPADM